MKKIKCFINKNIKLLILIVIGLIVSVSSVYSATILYQSDEIGYDNSTTGFKDSNGNDVEDVKTALDELYAKANACSVRNICPTGMKRVEGVNGEYSCVNPKSPEQYIKSLNTEGETISTSDHYNELRFIGANPNNYVKFNNQTWRIIGIFDGKLKLVANPIGNYSYDTSRNTVNNGYGVNIWGATTYVSDGSAYDGADLMKLLNPGFDNNSDLKCKTSVSNVNSVITCGDNGDDSYTTGLVNNSLYWNAGSGYCYNNGNHQVVACDFTTTGLTDQDSKDMIDNATWYLGSNVASDDIWGANQIMTADYLYTKERGSNPGKACSSGTYCNDGLTPITTWTGKVGLIYPSDYAYATSGDLSGNGTDRATCLSKQVGYVSASTTPNWANTYTDCKDNNWLLNKSMWTWSLSPRAGGSYSYIAFGVDTSGYVSHYNAVGAGSVRPVVFLKSSVTITRGDGTESKPFELSM